MIYSVVPHALAPELYERLASHYRDDPAVTVILDRRRGERRRAGSPKGGDRGLRDRRRRRPGSLPPLVSES